MGPGQLITKDQRHAVYDWTRVDVPWFSGYGRLGFSNKNCQLSTTGMSTRGRGDT